MYRDTLTDPIQDSNTCVYHFLSSPSVTHAWLSVDAVLNVSQNWVVLSMKKYLKYTVAPCSLNLGHISLKMIMACSYTGSDRSFFDCLSIPAFFNFRSDCVSVHLAEFNKIHKTKFLSKES